MVRNSMMPAVMFVLGMAFLVTLINLFNGRIASKTASADEAKAVAVTPATIEQCKIFVDTNDIEGLVNQWLKANPGIEVVQRALTDYNGVKLALAVFYREKK